MLKYFEQKQNFKFLFFWLSSLCWAYGISGQDILSQHVFEADSLASPEEVYLFVRGLEQAEEKGFNPFRPVGRFLYFLPKQISYGIRYASGYGAGLINDPKFIETIEDFFFSDDKSFGWYPIANFTSGLRPRIGANIFYKYNKFRILVRGKIADEEKYQSELRLSYRLKSGNNIWRFTLSGISEYDDDQLFYGIGADPRTDERSFFLPEPAFDYGIYFQNQQKLQLVIGNRPAPNWEYYLTSTFLWRKIHDSHEVDQSIAESFNLAQLPGLNCISRIFYNELAFRFDTSEENKFLSSGIKIEAYAGISRDFCNSNGTLLKTGIDALGNIPLIQDNRILVPRIVMNRIRNLSSGTPIPFVDYPRHPEYRGITERKLLRTDLLSLVPSVEYMWPLSFNLGGHLFFDQLLVAPRFNKLSLKNAPWALGIGIDFHSIDGELAKFITAYGSEGFHFSFNAGWSFIQ